MLLPTSSIIRGSCEIVAEPGQFNGYNEKSYSDCCNDKCKDKPGGPQDKSELDKVRKNVDPEVASEHAGDATYFHDTSIGTPEWIKARIRNGQMSEVIVKDCK